MLVKIGKNNGNRNSGNIYTRVILTEIYHLSGMKSFRDDLIDRMKTGWGRFVLASHKEPSLPRKWGRAQCNVPIDNIHFLSYLGRCTCSSLPSVATSSLEPQCPALVCKRK